MQKIAAKALRFGLDDHAPGHPAIPNNQHLAQECVDLLAVMEMLAERGIIPPFNALELIQAKKDKVLKYMNYAEERGTIL